MNQTTLEKEKRRCQLGLWNPKKDPWARRRTNYQCVNGFIVLPKALMKNEEIVDNFKSGGIEVVENKKIPLSLKWWQRFWNFIIKLFKK